MDPSVVLAVFENRYGKDLEQSEGYWSKLVDGIAKMPEVQAKEQCRMLKFARFGDQRTDKGSLRHDANVLEVYGIEADYDAGEVSLEAGRDMLAKYDILAAGYESWSCTPEKPRWRLLAPFAQPHAPEDRLRYVEALNGMLGGILAPESAKLSQAYYFGKPVGEKRDCMSIDGASRCIDELPDDLFEEIRYPFRPVENKRHDRRKAEPAKPRSQGAGKSAKNKPLLHPATIASALALLEPDMSYPDWIRVGMALHSTALVIIPSKTKCVSWL